MKQLTEKKSVTAPNAWGRDSTCNHQEFEVEESDVTRSREHWGGHYHGMYIFRAADVGRVILVMTEDKSDWTCWSFK